MCERVLRSPGATATCRRPPLPSRLRASLGGSNRNVGEGGGGERKPTLSPTQQDVIHTPLPETHPPYTNMAPPPPCHPPRRTLIRTGTPYCHASLGVGKAPSTPPSTPRGMPPNPGSHPPCRSSLLRRGVGGRVSWGCLGPRGRGGVGERGRGGMGWKGIKDRRLRMEWWSSERMGDASSPAERRGEDRWGGALLLKRWCLRQKG